ncbi:XRE family transcriptional regulator [Methylobacterium bullatum]|uniref:HTH cro/C1-type domain-containing protein n=1 Tax=Methylobacterium bullatum TaxID=570505 RepID=A0AAV4Z7X1_9HYPH|nr:XRE family transcriptional regulator [Methylobacterium bullatum]MBD8902826.1 DNA-binding protein [Methylobacterium bullatum]GJD39927.1 hypothetical protein OICFNHDK_2391 [Methylobacterium bullatum]
MAKLAVILNEREAREARVLSAEFDKALSSEMLFRPIISGLPPTVVTGFRKAIESHKNELQSLLDAYEAAKAGDYSALQRRAGNDPGLSLIVGRIARGLTQKELGRKLGLKEQQIQRYEADRYTSISLGNFHRVASVLGMQWTLALSDWAGSGWNVAKQISAIEVKKIMKHARENAWFTGSDIDGPVEEESFNYLQRYVSNHIVKYGTPTLLRTGFNVEDHSDDLLLVAWRARVTRIAEEMLAKQQSEYNPLDISWLLELVRLSRHASGPARARQLLHSKGILLIVERQIPGMKVDGAAFLVNGVPVIGLTLRRDALDNFWFTLLHEVAHVILHYRAGLNIGFFDDAEAADIDEVEREANDFASNMLIPDEKWKRSPARITKSAAVIEKFAQELEIHPAIVYGRIRKERNDYTIFSSAIGSNQVRKHFTTEG